MSKYDGGPAFPVPKAVGEDGVVQADAHAGMSLRDYFAAKLLPSLLRGFQPDSAAVMAYKYADAMLAEGSESDE